MSATACTPRTQRFREPSTTSHRSRPSMTSPSTADCAIGTHRDLPVDHPQPPRIAADDRSVRIRERRQAHHSTPVGGFAFGRASDKERRQLMRCGRRTRTCSAHRRRSDGIAGGTVDRRGRCRACKLRWAGRISMRLERLSLLYRGRGNRLCRAKSKIAVRQTESTAKTRRFVSSH